jgi:hypothetical protein
MAITGLVFFQTEDFALTDRYWDTVKNKEVDDPEQQLMLAILKDAIVDYKKYHVKQNLRFRDARKWLFEGDADHVFSFKHICSCFGLSAQKIRHDLLAVTQRTAETRAQARA